VGRPPAGERGSWRWACEFSLVLIAMLMLSERTWKHHYVTIVLPLSVVVLYMAGERPGTQVRRWLGAALTLLFAALIPREDHLIALAVAAIGVVWEPVEWYYFRCVAGSGTCGRASLREWMLGQDTLADMTLVALGALVALIVIGRYN